MRWFVAGCAVVAVAISVVLVAWPASSHPRSAQASYADTDGLIVFQQIHTLMLGSASPDGSHSKILAALGPLHGTDLSVASSDGRYLVNTEGDLVTMGAAGPVSVTALPQSALAETSGQAWVDASFADGGRYVEATECFQDPNYTYQSVANLIPVGGGGPDVLDPVSDSVGDPASAAAIESVLVDSSATSSFGCPGPDVESDKALELVQPGHRPHTIMTAAELTSALGLSPGTPLMFSANPSPDGSLLAVSAISAAQQSANTVQAADLGSVVITRAGQVVAHLRFPAYTSVTRWSPDGKQIASCQAGPTQSRVTIISIGKAARTIILPGRHDLFCTQLLWSPDERQLVYAAQTTNTGLTQADKMQRGWTVINLASGQVHNVTAAGQPVAWLPTRGQTG